VGQVLYIPSVDCCGLGGVIGPRPGPGPAMGGFGPRPAPGPFPGNYGPGPYISGGAMFPETSPGSGLDHHQRSPY
jgi:hypothetical protein